MNNNIINYFITGLGLYVFIALSSCDFSKTKIKSAHVKRDAVLLKHQTDTLLLELKGTSDVKHYGNLDSLLQKEIYPFAVSNLNIDAVNSLIININKRKLKALRNLEIPFLINNGQEFGRFNIFESADSSVYLNFFHTNSSFLKEGNYGNLICRIYKCQLVIEIVTKTLGQTNSIFIFDKNHYALYHEY